MAVRDLHDYFDDGALDYPGVPSRAFPEGKSYRVPGPEAKTGLWLTAIADLGVKKASGKELSEADTASLTLDDSEEITWYRRILGPAYDEMIADGVKMSVLKRIGDDAYLCFSLSVDVADVVLRASGKASARANRATRRATGTGTTRRRKAGSTSATAGTDIPARIPAPISTRSPSDGPDQAKTA